MVEKKKAHLVNLLMLENMALLKDEINLKESRVPMPPV